LLRGAAAPPAPTALVFLSILQTFSPEGTLIRDQVLIKDSAYDPKSRIIIFLIQYSVQRASKNFTITKLRLQF